MHDLCFGRSGSLDSLLNKYKAKCYSTEIIRKQSKALLDKYKAKCSSYGISTKTKWGGGFHIVLILHYAC